MVSKYIENYSLQRFPQSSEAEKGKRGRPAKYSKPRISDISLNPPPRAIHGLLNRKAMTRNRPQNLKLLRQWEKEWKKKRSEIDDIKRKRQADFFKVLFTHRDEFNRFHKAKRAGI